MSFGRKIQALRKEKGITLRKFAETLGKSPTFISKVERGEPVTPSEETIRSMAKILGADADELIFLAGKMPEDLSKLIKKRPAEMATFLRTVSGMPAKERQDLLKKLTKDDGK